MIKIKLVLLLLVLLTLSGLRNADSFELATTIEKNGNAVSLSGTGYTRLILIKIKTNEVGTIYLNGSVVVNQGVANIVMWSKVNNKFYFSKLPNLQNFSSNNPTKFSIPFSSPKDTITEVTLEVELPEGGQIKFDNLVITKS